MTFNLQAPFVPCGDQINAIDFLSKNIKKQIPAQVLLGVTGSGKTFTIANVIQNINKPTLILAHNKTLAAQLYQEFLTFFPENAVEYFVSYYDYYQPEAYIARNDTYIEKSLLINDEIDKLRLSATKSLLERKDVIVISSVSCIYGIGAPENYSAMILDLTVGARKSLDKVLLHLINMHYTRAETELERGSFRIRGETLDILPAYENKFAYRIIFEENFIIKIIKIDPLIGSIIETLSNINIYPGSHYVTPEAIREIAISSIKEELKERMIFFENRPIEKERIYQRTSYDLEMIKEIGFCKGIENYSRHFTQLPAGSPPSTLLDYFPKDFLLVIDESHQTLPQLRAMYHGDHSRKTSLINFGFRLPSAYDNRPLKFEEVYKYFHQVIYVSATPSQWELEQSKNYVVEQILRPTGIPDPEIEIKPASGQIDDLLAQIQVYVKEKKQRVLVISLTKKLSEEITSFLSEINIKAAYLHSDIDTLDRVRILNDLREGSIDVLIGVNLLREGLDLPEVALVAILDADKEGFLRSYSSLIQICGRAARNVFGKVIMYANNITPSMNKTITETQRRRNIQIAYNQTHKICPTPIVKKIDRSLAIKSKNQKNLSPFNKEKINLTSLSKTEVNKKIKYFSKLMKQAVKEYQFEKAAYYRDQINLYKETMLLIS